MAADGSQHVVTAQAPGYQTRSVTFLSDVDHDLALVLEPVKAPATATSKPHLPSIPPGSASATKTGPVAPGPDCNPPYRIDSAGIKTFRVECL